MRGTGLDLQLDWDNRNLTDDWLDDPGSRWLLQRIGTLAVEVTAAGARGPVLEVAAAEGVHACRIAAKGFPTFVVEPSPAMLDRVREHAAAMNVRVGVVRGIAETLPFRDGTFDRVLIDSAIDHVAGPDAAVREMTRVLRPDGRLVIGFVNYGGASARATRALYRVARGAGLVSRERRLAWDTPVPIEHSFECTPAVLRAVCEQYLEFVRAVDPAYRWKVGAEKDFGKAFFNPAFHRAYAAAERIANEALTGDATRSWLDDLAARGPFRTAAALGCDQGCPEGAWAARHASDRIDVYELSSDVIRRARAELPRGADVRYVEADLNFARLPPAAYDAVWSSGCLHHLVNLERLMEEVARALRPGGLFAVHDYVGERRFRLSDARLARVNAFLRDVPARFRHGGIDAVAWQPMLSPFCGVRSDEVLSVAAERFDVVHRATAGVLFPLFLYLDVDGLAREEPALLERLRKADATPADGVGPAQAYAVFRKRHG